MPETDHPIPEKNHNISHVFQAIFSIVLSELLFSFLQQQHNFESVDMFEELSGYFLKAYSINIHVTNFEVKLFSFFLLFLKFSQSLLSYVSHSPSSKGMV